MASDPRSNSKKKIGRGSKHVPTDYTPENLHRALSMLFPDEQKHLDELLRKHIDGREP